MTLTYGDLFAGYDGLGMGVRSVIGGETSWFAEFDKAPSKILEARYPGVPNLGDVTKIDWHAVPKVDVITGGSPCQDLSHAGKRAGMKAGTRSGLWASMCDAIDIIRPRLVVWENVRGALSAEADSEVEPCAGCVGDTGDGRTFLRALGRVLGDLAELGYDARWYGLRAADVGAAHGRFRVFLFATPANAGGRGGCEAIEHDGRGSTVSDGAGVPHQPDRDVVWPGPDRDAGFGADRWGDYAPAITRWEHVIGRPAPDPTIPRESDGKAQLSAAFCEWLMGLPAGHVTDVGITRNEQLKALGNGVVPAQAAAATRAWLEDSA